MLSLADSDKTQHFMFSIERSVFSRTDVTALTAR